MTTTPQAARLSESEIVACIAKAGCIGTVKMSYESGPYDIDRPSINASRLYDAIEAAILAKLQAAQAEPVQSKCLTCNGHGLIGGHMQDGSGYGEGCPDCNPEPSHADPIEIERKQRQAAVARFVDENRSRQTEPVQT